MLSSLLHCVKVIKLYNIVEGKKVDMDSKFFTTIQRNGHA